MHEYAKFRRYNLGLSSSSSAIESPSVEFAGISSVGEGPDSSTTIGVDASFPAESVSSALVAIRLLIHSRSDTESSIETGSVVGSTDIDVELLVCGKVLDEEGSWTTVEVEGAGMACDDDSGSFAQVRSFFVRGFMTSRNSVKVESSAGAGCVWVPVAGFLPLTSLVEASVF